MAYTAVAESKTAHLIDQLGRIVAADSTDDLAIRRVEREAKALMSTEPASAHTVLGGIAALRRDLDEVQRHHRIALDVRKSGITYFNFAVSLSLLGEMRGALEAAKSGLEAEPDDPRWLRHAIKLSMEAAHFSEARQLGGRWARLMPNEPHVETRNAMLVATAIDEGVFSEEKAQQVVGLFGTVQRSKGYLALTGFDVSVLRPDPTEPGSFAYERPIQASPSAAAELNGQYADRLLEAEDLLEDPGLRFVPMFIGVQHGGNS